MRNQEILWHDGLGMSLYAKRLEHGRFISYGLCQGILTRVSHRVRRSTRMVG